MTGQSITVLKIGDQLNNAVEIRRALREQDDPQLILDMIEGSTELHEAILVVHGEIQEDGILAEGLKAAIEGLQSRLARVEKSIETRRQIILSAMVKAEIGTIKSPTATLSVKETPRKTVISEEAEIPAKFWKPQDPVLDKKALGDALKAGEIVPGATLSNGGITLGVRVK
jgi:hypothetical protein